MNANLNRPTLVVGAFLFLHILLAYWSPFCVWGGDLLAFYPEWVRGLFLVLSGVVLIPHARQLMLHGMTRMSTPFDFWGSSRRSYFSRLLLALAGGIACVGMRSAIHLLGDGYLCLRDLPAPIQRFGHEPLALWILSILHQLGKTYWHSAESTHRLYSYLSGALYLLLTLPVARMLGRDRLEKTIILGFLLTPGFLQLFCGYVENYPLLYPGILLYLLTGFQTLRGRLSLWVPASLLGVLVPLHFTLVTLAPSLGILALFHTCFRQEVTQQDATLADLQGRKARRRSRQRTPGSGLENIESSRQPRRFTTALKTFASLSVAPTLALTILLALGFNPLTYMRELRGTHFFPLLAEPNFLQQYRLFAPAHLLDFFNQQLLIAPSALLVFFTLRRWKPTRHPERTFLLSAAVFPLLFTFVANPEIGAFRDWDVLAFPALPWTLWAALVLINQMQERSQLLHTGFLICGATALHSLLWIGLNANRASAEARYIRIMERSHLSAQARSYGWETLGSYYRGQNKPERALDAYKQALEATPENPRHWVSVGIMYGSLGQYQTAVKYFQKAIALKPDFAEAYANMGSAYNTLRQYQTAVEYLQKAVILKPDLAEAYANMGSAYYRLRQYQTAVEYLQKAIVLKPDLAEAYANMGSAYYRLGQYQTAAEYLQKAVALKPDLAEAYSKMGDVYSGLRQYQTAVEYFRKAVALKPDFTEVYSNMGNAYHNLGQYETAISYYQKAIALKPDFTEVYSNMGVAYYRLNQVEKSKDYFKKVLELNPNFPEAPAIRKWLQGGTFHESPGD